MTSMLRDRRCINLQWVGEGGPLPWGMPSRPDWASS